MSRLCLYYLGEPERDRWLPGDRYVRPLVRRIVRGKPRPGGLDTVFINLRLGLGRLGIQHEVNLPFDRLRPDDRVAVLGRGRSCLAGYRQPNPIVAGIGLMTHPSEWPDLCQEYPVVRYLQHSAWCDAVYRPWFGERCRIWPVGIDTASWTPPQRPSKSFDFLIYDKIHWDRDQRQLDLLDPILGDLNGRGLTYRTLRYGTYTRSEYREALSACRAMLVFSAHESQGLAYQEALSSGVPVLAWDPGLVQDPARFRWGQPEIPATSVPYFDARCGERFRDFDEYRRAMPVFWEKLNAGGYAPRDYILENLTLEKCAEHFVQLVDEAQPHRATPRPSA
ncbi:glycosyltransferase family 1 protein [Opitutaceae bacterium EW11]|nr:glycosyltransferase family 1 protein [Opitutaceae bacterium EW11]